MNVYAAPCPSLCDFDRFHFMYYAEQAENGGSFQRRLFAEDAARGFAFIDVCRKRYDVALMNPPFGEFSLMFRALANKRSLLAVRK